MRTFDYSKYLNYALDGETVALLAKVYEAKGKQNLYTDSNPAVLETLVAISKIQSTEASNRIEGIVTTRERIEALLKRKSKPLNRDEEEIAGYRDVLSTIHESHEYIPLSANTILQRHRDLLKFTGLGYAGHFKNTNNIIAERGADGKITRTIFEPLKPYETPTAVNTICEQYAVALNELHIDPLIVIPIFIHDFLCIHPFNDGNGRMSRLLTLLLFYQNNFSIGKYISIEKTIEKTKSEYYFCLEQSSEGWNDNSDSPLPFIKYMLRVLLAAYTDFEERVIVVSKQKLNKSDRVRRIFDTTLGKITKEKIIELLPDVSPATIKLALNKLVKEGYIKVVGTGPAAGYVKANGAD
jgi:Fic family protein